jgi:hypothetical protein
VPGHDLLEADGLRIALSAGRQPTPMICLSQRPPHLKAAPGSTHITRLRRSTGQCRPFCTQPAWPGQRISMRGGKRALFRGAGRLNELEPGRRGSSGRCAVYRKRPCHDLRRPRCRRAMCAWKKLRPCLRAGGRPGDRAWRQGTRVRRPRAAAGGCRAGARLAHAG